MRNLQKRAAIIFFGFFGVPVMLCPASGRAAAAGRAVVVFEGTGTKAPAAAAREDIHKIVVVFDGKSSTLAALTPLIDILDDTRAPDLWVRQEDLKRATGFEVKPQGVCRKELCFPLPKREEPKYLLKSKGKSWFNLSAFARLVKQPVAHDAQLNVWYFGARPEVQNSYLASLEAPAFTLPDMNGAKHSLADFRGKKVLLVTWASW